MNDTTPEARKEYHDAMMALSGEERVLLGARMFDAVREHILASLPKNLTELERKQMLFERIYGFPLPKDFGKGLDASSD